MKRRSLRGTAWFRAIGQRDAANHHRRPPVPSLIHHNGWPIWAAIAYSRGHIETSYARRTP